MGIAPFMKKKICENNKGIAKNPWNKNKDKGLEGICGEDKKDK
jgi:hypothetical protein